MAYLKKDDQWVCAGRDGKTTPLIDVVQNKKTPFYLYDLDDISYRVGLFKSSLQLHYAMKANCHPKVLDRIQSLGLGVDVVSGGELELALKHNFSPAYIVFSGVGKTVEEIEFALKTQILQINVESLAELKRIAQIAQRINVKAQIALRLNPDVEAKTHPYIQTGFRENKFGIDESSMTEVIEFIRHHKKNLKLMGLTLHIGSQILDLSSFRDAFLKTKKIFLDLRSEFDLSTFDIGGGLGILYGKEGQSDEKGISDYLEIVNACLSDLKGVRILSEPGRILVARCGLLVCQVEYIKQTPYKQFAIVNTGMHHLLRPALYQAEHRIEKLISKNLPPQTYDVVGPICESADSIAKALKIETLSENDFVLIFDAGAYGEVMASNYNLKGPVQSMVIE